MATTIDKGLQTGGKRTISRPGAPEHEGMPEPEQADAVTQPPDDIDGPSPRPHKTCSDGTRAGTRARKARTE